MIRLYTAALTLPMLINAAIAAPVVFHLNGDTDDDIVMSDIDPMLPSIRVYIEDTSYPGSGTEGHGYAPALIEDGVTCGGPPPSLIDVESLYSYQYQTRRGDLIEASSNGEWRYTEPRCSEEVFLSEVLFRSYLHDCFTCYDFNIALNSNRYYVQPVRWKPIDGDTWTYGWVGFRVYETPNPDPTCHNSCYDDPEWTFAHFDIVAFGMELEPEVPIIAGGGLCPGDINLDAERDIFDVFDYLDLFMAMDPDADYTSDGSYDIFDIFAFLEDFNSYCVF